MIENILALGAGTMGSQPAFYYAMHGFNVTQFDISEDALAACKQHHRSYVEGFSAWQGQPGVTADLDPLRFAQVSWGTLHGMTRLLLDGIYVDDKAKEAMCEAAAQMFWRALKA